MTDLRPCPICGCEARYVVKLKYVESQKFGVFCTNCKAKTPFYDTELDAVEAWNKRWIDK